LTALSNRLSILKILVREIELVKQYSTPLAVNIIDIDHFLTVGRYLYKTARLLP